jgi:regulatory protein
VSKASGSQETSEERLQRGLGWALAQLNRRERTTGEIRAHLERKGLEASLAEAVIAQLLSDGYLDDRRYAEMYVHDKRHLEGWGSERIRRELENRGLDRDLINGALNAGSSSSAEPETELERALALLQRRFPDPPRERRDRDRALGMLIRKGYDGELALDALTAHARAA